MLKGRDALELKNEVYSVMYEKEEGHWWFRGRRAILQAVLRELELPGKARILDVGCGTGGNLNFLKRYGAVHGCDYAEEALRFCRLRGFDDVRSADVCALPYPDDSYDLVVCLDVLEHVRLDTIAFQELVRVTTPGGFILVTLPADPRLYSSFDCLSGHLRRYRKREMEELARRNDLSLERCSRYFSLVHPLTRFYMWRGDLVEGRVKWVQNMETIFPVSGPLLSALCALEAFLLRYIDFPWGSNLFALFRK